MPVFEQARWKIDDSERWRPGLLISVSEAGLAMLTEHGETPVTGSRLHFQVGRKSWQRPLEVIRVDQLSGTMDLVAAEFDPSRETTTPEG